MDFRAALVEASLIGEGLGKLLWLNATRRATDLGHKKLRIIADPNAASFYVKQGAVRVGETVSRMDEKRILPILIYDLPKARGD